MSRLVQWEDLKPGMTVWLESRPWEGYRTVMQEIRPHMLLERLEDGKLRFIVDYGREKMYGRLKPGKPGRVRYWTDGEPTVEERREAPWPEEVGGDS